MVDRIKQKLFENLIGYVLTAVVGAALTYALMAGAQAARYEMLERQIEANSTAVKEIQKTLADGGPAALAQRVANLEGQINSMGSKVDRMYEVLVLRTSK